MDQITNLQHIIDERKDTIPDGTYLEICNEMKVLFEEEKKERNNNIYEITYIRTKVVPISLVNEFRAVPTTRKKILKLEYSQFARITRDIEDSKWSQFEECTTDVLTCVSDEMIEDTPTVDTFKVYTSLIVLEIKKV
jgi:hypothetical protein